MEEIQVNSYCGAGNVPGNCHRGSHHIQVELLTISVNQKPEFLTSFPHLIPAPQTHFIEDTFMLLENVYKHLNIIDVCIYYNHNDKRK